MTKYHDLTLQLDTIQACKRNLLFTLLEDKKLHFRQYPILEFILRNDGCKQVELAEYFSLSPATIAVSTKRMQKSGYIDKKEDINNLRQKNLFITPDGRDVIEKCRNIFDDVDNNMYDGLLDVEIEQFKKTIDRITSNIISYSSDKVDVKKIMHFKKRIECIDSSQDNNSE